MTSLSGRIAKNLFAIPSVIHVETRSATSQTLNFKNNGISKPDKTIKEFKYSKNLVPSKMKAWQLTSFSGIDNLVLQDVDVPALSTAQDLLIKVKAASLNPLDAMMAKGYGNEVLRTIRGGMSANENVDGFPLTLGRDFSGEVVDVGMDVTEFSPGDEVWGALFPTSQGSHAEYVVASKYSVGVSLLCN